MSDFIGDLERELVAAARRRAARRPRVHLPRLRPATVLAFVALAAFAVALIAVVRGIDGGSRPADELPSVPPGPGVVMALPAAPVAAPCPGVEQREVAGGVQPPLSVFSRPRTGADAVPELAGADSFSWIRAGIIHRVDARRAAQEGFGAQVYLVPAADPREDGACDGRPQHVLAVCLVVVDGETVARCFEEDEVEGGRALALTSPGVVHGVVPDGVKAVTLSFGDHHVTAQVVDNAYELGASVQAGQSVRVELVAATACEPTPALLDAVPALEDARRISLPESVEQAAPSGGLPRYARQLEDRDGLELWVVTQCEDARRACVVVMYEGDSIAMPCGSAAETRRGGTSWTFPVAGRLAVAGLAPAGADGVRVVLDGGAAVHPVSLQCGVFAAILPPRFGSTVDPEKGDMSGRIDIRYR